MEVKYLYHSYKEYLQDYPDKANLVENCWGDAPFLLFRVEDNYANSVPFWCAYICYYIDPNKIGKKSIFDWHIKINDGDDLYMIKRIESIKDVATFYREIRDILPATPTKLKTIGFEYE